MFVFVFPSASFFFFVFRVFLPEEKENSPYPSIHPPPPPPPLDRVYSPIAAISSRAVSYGVVTMLVHRTYLVNSIGFELALLYRSRIYTNIETPSTSRDGHTWMEGHYSFFNRCNGLENQRTMPDTLRVSLFRLRRFLSFSVSLFSISHSLSFSTLGTNSSPYFLTSYRNPCT